MKAKKSKSQGNFTKAIFALVAGAVVLSLLSLAVRTSLPSYGPDGKQVYERTVVLPDGHKLNSENKNYGWPVPYYITTCWGMDEDCWPSQHTDWILLLMNILVWFAMITTVSAAYLHIRKGVRR
jgi:hypothetical protein